jgi:hypothetical protein
MVSRSSLLIGHKGLITSEDGLTSVITTVAIIALIMGFIVGPYFLIIVPEQIKQNESSHQRDVEESFLDLRGNVYDQLDSGTTNTVLSTHLKMGTEDQDLFVIGGDGELEIDPSQSLFSIHEYYDPLSIYARGSGNIEYSTRNFYHPDKGFIYENGAVITSQKRITDMASFPDFDIDRHVELQDFGFDSDFGQLRGSNEILGNLFLINTGSTSLTINRAIVSWDGGNATFLNRLNIAGSPIEWSGSAASGVKITFSSAFVLNYGIETMNLRFNADMVDSRITVELFTSASVKISDTWPNLQLDTATHGYDIAGPSGNSRKFIFKNICDRPVTLNNIAVSWNGSATLTRININNHGDDVWDVGLPGESSPVFTNVEKTSLFQPNQQGEVLLFFNGDIRGQFISIRFFSENSTNMANTVYPVSLNETYVNVSLSALTLVTKSGDKIHTTGKGTKVIQSTLISGENNRYIWEQGEMIVFNITTQYENSWFEYFNDTLTNDNDLIWDSDGIGSFPGDYFVITTELSDDLINIQLILNYVNKLECIIGIVKIELT